MYESFFIFDGKFYEQCDRVAIGFPLGFTFSPANFFMCHFDWKTVFLIPNQLFTGDLLMIHFHFLDQKIMLKNLKVISTNNVKA